MSNKFTKFKIIHNNLKKFIKNWTKFKKMQQNSEIIKKFMENHVIFIWCFTPCILWSVYLLSISIKVEFSYWRFSNLCVSYFFFFSDRINIYFRSSRIWSIKLGLCGKLIFFYWNSFLFVHSIFVSKNSKLTKFLNELSCNQRHIKEHSKN